MLVRIVEVEAAGAARPLVDLAGLLMARVGPVGDPGRLDSRMDRVEILVGDREGVVLDEIVAGWTVMKSSVTPLPVSMGRNGPVGAPTGRPRTSARKAADRSLSRARTIV